MSHQSDLIATDINAYLEQHERKELLRFITCGSVDDGKSTLIAASGKYEGNYKNGNKHGQGKATWVSGSSYSGEYRDDKRNGKGIFTYADGRIYEGIFKNDWITYPYTITYPYSGETVRMEVPLTSNEYEKQRIVAELRDRCAKFSYEEEWIDSCVKKEAQRDLELAQQNKELELMQQRVVQSRQTQVAQEEVPWWLEFLADVAIGVAEGYKQNAIHNSQHKNDKPKVIYKRGPDNVYLC